MKRYKSKDSVLLLTDIIAITCSFIIAISIRFSVIVDAFGSRLVVPLYFTVFIMALLLYIVLFFLRRRPRLDKLSNREIIINTIDQQLVFVAIFVILFFALKKSAKISRIVVGLFFIGNVLLCSVVRLLYKDYCIRRTEEILGTDSNQRIDNANVSGTVSVRHCYIIGAKSIGLYGGFESFLLNLLKHHKDRTDIKYHIACKANGQGYMELDELPGAVRINENEFSYCNAHCFFIKIPERFGSAQAIYYDIAALRYVCDHIENNHIEKPIVYILASRIGPFERKYVRRIHDAGGRVFQNPDGHEDWRRRWHPLIRKYWKFSEQYAVKNADLVVCDSKSIEEYIIDEYSQYKPRTTFIAYGSYITPSLLTDDDPRYTGWLEAHNLRDGQFYISVGRFVEENNFDIMIREFMRSNTSKDFAIITTDNPKYAEQLQQKLHFKMDKRIKFVGTVYDQELLAKIRANAYGYIHGHEVGGTNPSLLEALGSTDINLLLNVGFNKEVAENSALYWDKTEGGLATEIDIADKMSIEDRMALGDKAKQRILEEYSWDIICEKYIMIFLN